MSVAQQIAYRSRREVLAGLLATAGAVPLLGACSPERQPSSTGPTAALETFGSGSMSRVELTLGEVPELAAVVHGISDFGRHLHDVAAQPNQNFTVSPLSIAAAFAMLRAGARGSTARQLDDVFGFPSTGDPAGSPHRAMNALTAAVVTPSDAGQRDRRKSVVSIANGLFIDDDFRDDVDRRFLSLLASQYGANPELVDFASGTAAVRAIDAWVNDATRGRIPTLFSSLDPATVLVLANAVYLKATWAAQFDASRTSPGPFTTSRGDIAQVPLMRQRMTRAGYLETPDWQLVRLPYADGELSMRVLLPREALTLPAQLTQFLADLVRPADTLGSGSVDLTLPKWDTATDLPLLDPMAALGLTQLDDLSGIGPSLFVSDARHKANITVDELGSEAAAATGIAVAVTGVIDLRPPAVMTVNRPYVWAVVHEPTGLPTFLGSVVDPRG